MSESHLAGRVTLHHGDSRDVLKTFADCSVDSVVCDPPYALVSIVKRFGSPNAAPARDGDVYARASAGFMGQSWDTGETAFAPEFWAEVLRVLKPGGHVIAASGTRTYHRLACAIEDAGFEFGPSFEIRDMITKWLESDTFASRFLDSLSEEQMRALLLAADEREFSGLFGWLFGSGFPKSLDVSKGIDKAAGVEREIVGVRTFADGTAARATAGMAGVPGSGTAGQAVVTTPATPEARQWQGWGTALKPACEPWVLARKPLDGTVAANVLAHGTGAFNIDGCRIEAPGGYDAPGDRGHADNRTRASEYGLTAGSSHSGGRWPANVIHDGSEEVVAHFPVSDARDGANKGDNMGYGGAGQAVDRDFAARRDTGSAARFFYTAKADANDRAGSKHPTVKPVDLMQYLCRLVTPPGGVVLDPFAGSGTTGEAAWREGFRAILIEREADYCDDIRRRLAMAEMGPEGRAFAIAKAKGADDAGPLFGAAA